MQSKFSDSLYYPANSSVQCVAGVVVTFHIERPGLFLYEFIFSDEAYEYESRSGKSV